MKTVKLLAEHNNGTEYIAEGVTATLPEEYADRLIAAGEAIEVKKAAPKKRA